MSVDELVGAEDLSAGTAPLLSLQGVTKTYVDASGMRTEVLGCLLYTSPSPRD